VDIKVDISELTLGDMEILSNQEKFGFSEQLAVLERIVVEGDVRKIRLIDLPKVAEMIQTQVEAAANPT